MAFSLYAQMSLIRQTVRAWSKYHLFEETLLDNFFSVELRMRIMEHFNWMYLIPNIGHDWAHVFILGASSLVLLCIGLLARKALLKSDSKKAKSSNLQQEKENLVPGPAGHFSIQALFEFIVEFISDLSENVMGEKGRHFVPLFSTLFLFVLFNNLVGLIPGMEAATGNINTTLALGSFSFLLYNICGFRVHGWSYLKQFAGPVLYLAPLMVLIELISHFVRPLSLSLRLYGSMMGDHTVLGVFLSITAYVVPVLFYAFGAFLATIQAFIFTLLNMIYISLAISEEH